MQSWNQTSTQAVQPYRTYIEDLEITIPSSPVFEWNYNATERVVINQGGTSSGKTYSILQVLLLLLILNDNKVCTVIGQDIPNLKKGAMRDFVRILDAHPELKLFIRKHNVSDRTYYFTNGSVLEFTSYQDEQDAKSGKRDYAFFNEANGISYAIYNQIAMRTSTQIFIDYNPTNSFWAHENLFGLENVVVFYSNYSHNPYVSPEIIKHVRQYKELDPELWRVYGLGKTGKIQGLVFPNVKIVPEFPRIIKKRCFGLDFGFTNDPTALVEMGEVNGELWGQELLYERNLTNQDIVSRFKELKIPKTVEIFADAAEPKSIEEIRRAGYLIRSADKGADSVRSGINTIKSWKLNITADSTKWRKEALNYKWKEDPKDGTLLNIPVDAFNHLWDAARYATIMRWGKHVVELPKMYPKK